MEDLLFASLNRPYKERNPGQTINKIRGILERLDLVPSETPFANPFPEVFSASLELPPEKGGFRTNGKGRTREYCLASAYAEYMERLQNGLYGTFSRTIASRLRAEQGFIYDPDEKFMSRDEFRLLPESITSDLVRWTAMNREEFIEAYFERIDSHGAAGTIAVPFYCTRSREQEYLPLNLLLIAAGSNGMAAGNTLAEALFQALCELMERWGAARVFYDQLTPPTVPDEYLQQFKQECEVIRGIERSGKYQVVVKDFSAGQGIPAIGLIVKNGQAGTYRLNAGCDTSFQVALSRCLTEVFQGMQNQEALDLCMLKVPTQEMPYFMSNNEAALNLRYAVFSQFTKDNSGLFPTALFGSEPSYPFDPATFLPRSSYQEEVVRLINFFHARDHTLYIRDASYLGFPSVFVYVPGISTLGRKNVPVIRQKPTYDMIEWDKAEPMICSLRRLSQEELLSLAGSLQTLPPQASVTDLLNVKLKPGCRWSQLSVSFLLSLIWQRIERTKEAAETFKRFLETRPDNVQYYQVAARYLDLRADGRSAPETKPELASAFGENGIVQEVCRDLEVPEHAFNHVQLPECPDCPTCALKPDCLTTNQIRIARAVLPEMKARGAASRQALTAALDNSLGQN